MHPIRTALKNLHTVKIKEWADGAITSTFWIVALAPKSFQEIDSPAFKPLALLWVFLTVAAACLRAHDENLWEIIVRPIHRFSVQSDEAHKRRKAEEKLAYEREAAEAKKEEERQERLRKLIGK